MYQILYNSIKSFKYCRWQFIAWLISWFKMPFWKEIIQHFEIFLFILCNLLSVQTDWVSEWNDVQSNQSYIDEWKLQLVGSGHAPCILCGGYIAHHIYYAVVDIPTVCTMRWLSDTTVWIMRWLSTPPRSLHVSFLVGTEINAMGSAAHRVQCTVVSDFP